MMVMGMKKISYIAKNVVIVGKLLPIILAYLFLMILNRLNV